MNIFHVLEDDGSISVLTAETIPATVSITGELSGLKRRMSNIQNRRNEKREHFNSCTDHQQTVIDAAITQALTACSDSINELQNGPGGDLETEWFGAYTDENHNQVVTTYQVTSVLFFFC